jgi:uncharacterized protein (TIGR02284 family)
MAERNEREVLNHLIETCKDGEHGFRYAANHVTTGAVKSLFLDIAQQRERFVEELLPHAHRLGGANEAAGTAAAALHRGWMTIKDTLTHHDEQAVIQEAVRGEQAAETAYKDAVGGMLPPTARDLIERQYKDIRIAHARVSAFLSAV